MPITSTMDSKEIVFAEMPNGAIKMNVPIKDTGTATAGIKVARHVPKDRKTVSNTRTNASKIV